MGDRNSGGRGGEPSVVAAMRPGKATSGVPKNWSDNGRVSVINAESSNGEGVNHKGNKGRVNA